MLPCPKFVMLRLPAQKRLLKLRSPLLGFALIVAPPAQDPLTRLGGSNFVTDAGSVLTSPKPEVATLEQALQAFLGFPRKGRAVVGYVSGFRHAPVATTAAGELLPGGDLLALAAITGALEDAIAREPGNQANWAQARVALAWGRAAEASDLLETLSRRLPESASVLSDLSAAFLERARQGGGAHESVRGLDAAARALELDPACEPAHFNVALALEQLHLRTVAREAWKTFGKGCGSLGWCDEAKARLEDLTRGMDVSPEGTQRLTEALEAKSWTATLAMIQKNPGAARLLGEERLLRMWSEALLAGRESEAALHLYSARQTGKALLISTGDGFLADTVLAIDAARDDPGVLGQVAQAIVLLLQGMQSEERDDFQMARPLYVDAQRLLQSAKSPLAYAVANRLAVCDYYRSDYDEARDNARKARQLVAADRYPALVARSYWLEGLVDLVVGDSPSAMVRFERALELFSRLREEAHVGFMNSLAASVLWRLGESERAWTYRARALSSLDRHSDDRRVYSILSEGAEDAQADGWKHASLYFYDEASVRITSTSRPGLTAELRLRRAKVLALLGRDALAMDELVRASAAAANIGDSNHRDRVETDLTISRAILLSRAAPAVALRLLDAAVAQSIERGYELEVPELHVARADALRRLGNASRAESELRSAISRLESTALRLQDEGRRARMLALAQPLYDELLRVSFETGADPESLLAISEQARRFSLAQLGARPTGTQIDVLSTPPARKLSAVLDGLPPGSVAIEFAVLPERTFAWTVHNGAVVAAWEISRNASDLREEVGRLRADVLVGQQQSTAGQIYRQFLQPAERWLARAELLVIVPDKFLYGLPFAALRNQSGALIIERAPLMLAPSLGAVGGPALMDGGEKHSLESVLVVVREEAALSELNWLPSLRGAAAEAKSIAQVYATSWTLANELATPSAFLQLAPNADVLHISAHTLPNVSEPLESVLALAPEPSSELGLLAANRLLEVDLGRTRVAVLAGCGTGTGPGHGRQSPLGLAGAFLAAGVPSVIASLWSVDDESTVPLMSQLHRGLRSGLNPARALQAAQLSAYRANLANSRPETSGWASFVLIATGPAARSGFSGRCDH